MNTLLKLIEIANDPANEAISRLVDRGSAVVAAQGVGAAVAEQAGAIEPGLDLAQWSIILGMVATGLLVIKTGLEIFLRWEERRLRLKDRRESNGD